MKEELKNIPLVRNEADSRFELTVDGHTAFIDYRLMEGVIALVHTESPEALAGRGVASALIEKTLVYFEENNIDLIPLCPMVFAFIKKRPEWLRIVKENCKSRFQTD